MPGTDVMQILGGILILIGAALAYFSEKDIFAVGFGIFMVACGTYLLGIF